MSQKVEYWQSCCGERCGKLSCSLYPGHEGLHEDKFERVEWRSTHPARQSPRAQDVMSPEMPTDGSRATQDQSEGE